MKSSKFNHLISTFSIFPSIFITIEAFSPIGGFTPFNIQNNGRDQRCSIHHGRNDLILERGVGTSYHKDSLVILDVKSNREDEIRRKIMKLKKEGKMKDKGSSSSTNKEETDVDDEYANKIRDKLGNKAKLIPGLIGAGSFAQEDDDDDDDDDLPPPPTPLGQKKQVFRLGSIEREEEEMYDVDYDDDDEGNDGDDVDSDEPRAEAKEMIEMLRRNVVQDDDDDNQEMNEDELLKLVAKKLAEKKKKLKDEKQQEEQKESDNPTTSPSSSSTSSSSSFPPPKQTTTGVGGTWSPPTNTTSEDDEAYRPSRGSWGYFPRPKDISKAYGGGRRVGAGVSPSKDDMERQMAAEESTKEKLKKYREKVGIEVQSEKENNDEIQVALEVSRRAMQRGLYDAAVTTLEKITKYCSTNSPLGGNVFLELGMAYEAAGRTSEAITVYNRLTKSLNDEVKTNASRLLSGIEALQFMREVTGGENNAKSEFSRKNVQKTFVETTGLANIADMFDDRYNTAWIDMEGDFYKKLTESVVRSMREARQILLMAVGSGEVSRRKVVQALRSISRYFDDELEEEEELEKLQKKEEEEEVVLMDGKPIAKPRRERQKKRPRPGMAMSTLDKFILPSHDQMLQNLDGEWRIQLLADKRGDGVQYFNTTLAWLLMDTTTMTFRSSFPTSAFLTLDANGKLQLEEKGRRLTRVETKTSGSGAWLSSINKKQKKRGAYAAITNTVQVMLVDSNLLITRLAGKTEDVETARTVEGVKDYFCVWRKVKIGTYSTGERQKP